ncbi:putative membrane protein [Sphingomonas jinjuensis]|uniref:Putative membrane protein n=1 Tax=Sphingomonas jinjuensis TaxID=535907 RepID=A0A840F3M7_9SPHN|nr:DUF2238 domain-containing protein [Sphingomonas jinjuensis]MBB4152440.1 putative membrane protein [Sphingomonas jinjuensis]
MKASGYERRLAMLALTWTAGLAASFAVAADRATWAMEVAPAPLVLAGLLLARRRWRASGLALLLIAGHGLVLMMGGAYTYAKVPLGFTLQDWLGLARNPFDRIGHFLQGFVPAIVLREIVIGTGAIRPGRFCTAAVLAFCLAISAAYELIEFAAAQAMGQGADAFLETQGDPWDTQWDMLTCLIGAALALILLSWLDDRLIGAVVPRGGDGHEP